ncbi:MAG TPA: hypothetical protein GXX72_02875 [Clostridiaceae bacterium]|nr:hypothetical protein [Clostridiaceae bacterium]
MRIAKLEFKKSFLSIAALWVSGNIFLLAVWRYFLVKRREDLSLKELVKENDAPPQLNKEILINLNQSYSQQLLIGSLIILALTLLLIFFFRKYLVENLTLNHVLVRTAMTLGTLTIGRWLVSRLSEYSLAIALLVVIVFLALIYYLRQFLYKLEQKLRSGQINSGQEDPE